MKTTNQKRYEAAFRMLNDAIPDMRNAERYQTELDAMTPRTAQRDGEILKANIEFEKRNINEILLRAANLVGQDTTRLAEEWKRQHPDHQKWLQRQLPFGFA